MPSFAILLLAVAAVLGTLAVTPLSADLRAVVDAGLIALAFYGVSHRCGPSRFRVLLVIALVGAAANAEIRQSAAHTIVAHRTSRYAAVVLDRLTDGDATQLTLGLQNGPTVVARIRGPVPATGSSIIIRGRLEPFDDARNPEEASERTIESERGLDGRLDGAAILGKGPSSRWTFSILLARAHDWAHVQLRKTLGEPAASLLAGELWGERASLPPRLREEFQETGTVHILVTAGLHLGAVTALCITLLAFLALPRWATCLATIAILWIFAWWSGAHLPALRAATMVTAALTARALGRAAFSWNALAIAALAVTFARPQSIATASFALSFSCVGAIFAVAGPLDRWLEARVALPDRMREAVVLSTATQLGVWPLAAAVFLQFTPYAVAANFAIVPCVAFTMALTAAQLLLCWCGPLAQACANLSTWCIAWTLGVVQTISSLPSSSVPMTPAPAWCIAAYDSALVALPMLWRRGARTVAIAAIAVATAWVLWPPHAQDRRLRVTVLDVGQADAIVVQTPRGHTLLIDAGGRLERGGQGNDSLAERVGERTVVPFLLRHGVHALDVVILSHPHGDHAGGVAPVLRRLHVAEIGDSGQRYGGHAYQDALATARKEGVPVVYPRAGDAWHSDDGIVLRFIGPSSPLIGGRNAINSNSVAFMLQYHRFRMLFTGDAGSDSEGRFLAQGTDLHAEVLKVGHHGSAYGSSAAFIAAVAPKYAVISVGRHNLFGHPAAETLQTLRRFGAQIYRTDKNGAVTILSDGTTEAISSMLAGDDR